MRWVLEDRMAARNKAKDLNERRVVPRNDPSFILTGEWIVDKMKSVVL